MGRPRNKPCDCGAKLHGEGRDDYGRRAVRCSKCRRKWSLDSFAEPPRRAGRLRKAESLALNAAGSQHYDDVLIAEYEAKKPNKRGGKPLPEPTDTVKIEGTVIQLRPEEAERFLELQRAKRLNGLCGPDVESPLIDVKIPAED
jgi:hypothetical protein